MVFSIVCPQKCGAKVRTLSKPCWSIKFLTINFFPSLTRNLCAVRVVKPWKSKGTLLKCLYSSICTSSTIPSSLISTAPKVLDGWRVTRCFAPRTCVVGVCSAGLVSNNRLWFGDSGILSDQRKQGKWVVHYAPPCSSTSFESILTPLIFMDNNLLYAA